MKIIIIEKNKKKTMLEVYGVDNLFRLGIIQKKYWENISENELKRRQEKSKNTKEKNMVMKIIIIEKNKKKLVY